MLNMGPDEEFAAFDKNDSWRLVFQKIRQESRDKHTFSLKDAKRPEFRSRNRYRDVSPYDHSRIQLERDEIDYINASLVESPDANRSYILTQGPLPLTCGHFWLMAWEQNSSTVLMLNKMVEMGRGPLPNTSGHFWLMIWEQNSKAVLMLNKVTEKGQIKCHQYFPVGNGNQGEDELLFEDVDLKVCFHGEVTNTHYTVRSLELCDLRSGQRKFIQQYQYTEWPDFDVPQSPQAFLDFLFDVRKSGALDRNAGPPIIHCSAGIGRSGTFCLVDTCLILIEKDESMQNIDVCKVLMDMRHFRMGLIQTQDQLRFSYLAIIEGSKNFLPPSHATSPDSGFEDPVENKVPESNGRVNAMDIDRESDEDSLPDTPPPLPPRLDRSMGHPADSDVNEAPSGGPLQNNQCSSGDQEVLVTAGNSVNSDIDAADFTRKEGVEIRRRKREERIKGTAEKIAHMKRRQQESERWRATKRNVRPMVLGISLVVLFGGYLIYSYYAS